MAKEIQREWVSLDWGQIVFVEICAEYKITFIVYITTKEHVYMQMFQMQRDVSRTIYLVTFNSFKLEFHDHINYKSS